MKKKVFALAAAAALSVAMLAGCSGSDSSSSSDSDSASTSADTSTMTAEEEEEAWKQEPMYGQKIVVGYGGANCVAACYVAEVLGFNDEEGLDVDVIRCASVSSDTMSALSAGQFLMTETHISAATVPITNGIEATMVGTAQTGCQSLYVLEDSEYQTTSDLIGKNVNVPLGIGSQDHNIVLRFMGKDGLSADDYNFKVTEQSAAVQGLQNGELDATLLPDQYAYQFVQDGVIRPIRSLTWDDDFNTEPCCVMLLNNDFLEQNPITAKKLARATAKASAWIDSHTEDSVSVMLDNEMISGDQDMLNVMQGTYDWTVTNDKCKETMENVITDYRGFGLITSSKSDEELLDQIWQPILTQDELDEVWAEGEAFEYQG